MSSINIYTVMAYRYGVLSGYSYLVGPYTSFKKAMEAAEFEEEYRGYKYACIIYETPVNSSFDGKTMNSYETDLFKRSTADRMQKDYENTVKRKYSDSELRKHVI